MKVYVQWSLADPQDWQLLDMATIQAWRNLPKKPVPVGGEVIDNTPGWPYAVNVQGVLLYGWDHWAAAIVNKQLVVTVWRDDPDDLPPEEFVAQVWTFGNLRPDPRYGDELNTDQLLTVYAGANVAPRWEGKSTTGGPVTVLPWADFVPPTEQNTRHGIWLPDALDQAHHARESIHGWQEWATP